MIYLLDTNMLIFMARGSKSTRPHKNQERAAQIDRALQTSSGRGRLGGLVRNHGV